MTKLFEYNARKMLAYLLFKQYQNEFKPIDGLNQHPSGLTYYEWLEKKVGVTPKKGGDDL